jgi:hypothetical protein
MFIYRMLTDPQIAVRYMQQNVQNKLFYAICTVLTVLIANDYAAIFVSKGKTVYRMLVWSLFILFDLLLLVAYSILYAKFVALYRQ